MNVSDNVRAHIKPTLISALSGVIAITIMIVLLALVACVVDIQDGASNALAIVAVAFGGIVCGFTNGRQIKRKGIFAGLASGGIIALLLLLLKAMFFEPVPTALTFVKIIILLVCAMIGGIFGVNKKTKRIKY